LKFRGIPHPRPPKFGGFGGGFDLFGCSFWGLGAQGPPGTPQDPPNSPLWPPSPPCGEGAQGAQP
ncbi:hypothetical protein HGM15179_021964, partial [Zosterops borbonicus]